MNKKGKPSKKYLNIYNVRKFNYHLVGRGEVRMEKGFRLYIKHHFRHPSMNQSVAIVCTTDGLEASFESLTVFINVA